MKIIDDKELRLIIWAANGVRFFHNLETSIDPPADLEMTTEQCIEALLNIANKPDYKMSDHDEFMMTLGREHVNPNFDYCVLSESLMDTLYLTDDYEKALRKAKSLSTLNDHVFSVFSIKETEDGYKTFYEMQYDGGEPVEPSSYMFLHYDYLAQAVKSIVKL